MSAFRGNYRRLAAVVCLGLAMVHAKVCAEEPTDIRAKCTAFLQKVVTARRKGLDERLAAEVASVTQATGLDPAGTDALRRAAVAAEDAAQAELLAKAVENYAKVYTKNGGQGLDGLDRPEIVASFAQPNSGFDRNIHYIRALDQPAWKDALARVLTPAQADQWKKFLADRDDAASKEYETLLDGQAEDVRHVLAGPMLIRSTEITEVLGLSGERASTVADLAKRAIDTSLAAWRRNARASFLANNEEGRAQTLRNARNSTTMPSDDDAPVTQAVWTDGLARLLSDEDRAKLQAARDAQRQRRTRALAAILLTLMDERVALTAVQRPPLEPVAERIVARTEPFYPAARNNSDYFSLSPTAFYKAAADVNPEEVRPPLDDVQWKRWREAGAARSSPNQGYEDGDAEGSSAASPDKPNDKRESSAIEEPEDLEQTVSDYLQRRAEAQHRDLDAATLLRVEDIARVATLSPEVTARLRTAAYGAAESALATWIISVEQSVRSQVQGATRENIKARISAVSRYSYGQVQAQDQEVWKVAVKGSLTFDQQDAWQTERDARAQYAADATAQYLLAEFDRRFFLSSEQWERLAPLVQNVVREYQPDINRLFTYHTAPWFLTSYYLFLPLHAIPEADCKAIVGKERYDRWAESNDYRYSVQYWDNLRQSHERRLKEEGGHK